MVVVVTQLCDYVKTSELYTFQKVNFVVWELIFPQKLRKSKSHK